MESELVNGLGKLGKSCQRAERTAANSLSYVKTNVKSLKQRKDSAQILIILSWCVCGGADGALVAAIVRRLQCRQRYRKRAKNCSPVRSAHIHFELIKRVYSGGGNSTKAFELQTLKP